MVAYSSIRIEKITIFSSNYKKFRYKKTLKIPLNNITSLKKGYISSMYVRHKEHKDT